MKLEERTCPGLSDASRLQHFPCFPFLTQQLLRKKDHVYGLSPPIQRAPSPTVSPEPVGAAALAAWLTRRLCGATALASGEAEFAGQPQETGRVLRRHGEPVLTYSFTFFVFTAL